MKDTKKWLKAAAIRMIKTMAQTTAALMVADVTFWSMDWKMMGGVAITAGIFSLLTSIGGIPEVK